MNDEQDKPVSDQEYAWFNQQMIIRYGKRWFQDQEEDD